MLDPGEDLGGLGVEGGGARVVSKRDFLEQIVPEILERHHPEIGRFFQNAGAPIPISR